MTKENSNSHRSGKENFQAFLTPEEMQLVDLAVKAEGCKSRKELLIALVKQRLKLD